MLSMQRLELLPNVFGGVEDHDHFRYCGDDYVGVGAGIIEAAANDNGGLHDLHAI